MVATPFEVKVSPNWEGLVRCIRRQGTPDRVYHIELFLDGEVQDAICKRYGVLEGLAPSDPFFLYKKQIALQRFLGYDYVRARIENMDMPLRRLRADDTAALSRESGRTFQDEHVGPITSWEEFEAYPWPDPTQPSVFRAFEWYERNLPDDMCMIASGGFAHFCEYLTWLMGYESLCYALYEKRDLVRAIADRLTEMFRVTLDQMLDYEKVKIVWGSDDMGFRSATLISPDDLREFVLPGHRLMAEMSHRAGRPYLLHSCGNLAAIIDDLVDDVKIDAKHSFEDTIEQVTEVKHTYGRRIALLGGIDVDFMCRSDAEAVRTRVRETLEICQPGGGYCLGTGNSVANYIPLDNYLAMVDEGRLYGH